MPDGSVEKQIREQQTRIDLMKLGRASKIGVPVERIGEEVRASVAKIKELEKARISAPTTVQQMTKGEPAKVGVSYDPAVAARQEAERQKQEALARFRAPAKITAPAPKPAVKYEGVFYEPKRPVVEPTPPLAVPGIKLLTPIPSGMKPMVDLVKAKEEFIQKMYELETKVGAPLDVGSMGLRAAAVGIVTLPEAMAGGFALPAAFIAKPSETIESLQATSRELGKSEFERIAFVTQLAAPTLVGMGVAKLKAIEPKVAEVAEPVKITLPEERIFIKRPAQEALSRLGLGKEELIEIQKIRTEPTPGQMIEAEVKLQKVFEPRSKKALPEPEVTFWEAEKIKGRLEQAKARLPEAKSLKEYTAYVAAKEKPRPLGETAMADFYKMIEERGIAGKEIESDIMTKLKAFESEREARFIQEMQLRKQMGMTAPKKPGIMELEPPLKEFFAPWKSPRALPQEIWKGLPEPEISVAAPSAPKWTAKQAELVAKIGEVKLIEQAKEYKKAVLSGREDALQNLREMMIKTGELKEGEALSIERIKGTKLWGSLIEGEPSKVSPFEEVVPSKLKEPKIIEFKPPKIEEGKEIKAGEGLQQLVQEKKADIGITKIAEKVKIEKPSVTELKTAQKILVPEGLIAKAKVEKPGMEIRLGAGLLVLPKLVEKSKLDIVTAQQERQVGQQLVTEGIATRTDLGTDLGGKVLPALAASVITASALAFSMNRASKQQLRQMTETAPKTKEKETFGGAPSAQMNQIFGAIGRQYKGRLPERKRALGFFSEGFSKAIFGKATLGRKETGAFSLSAEMEKTGMTPASVLWKGGFVGKYAKGIGKGIRIKV